MKKIVMADRRDKDEILTLYRMQLGREFCPWDENYPGEKEIDFDLSREALFVMKDEEDKILAAVSIDEDEAVNTLPCWNLALQPGGELARLAVLPQLQGQGIAREMMRHGMEVLRERGYRSIHFLVNKKNVKAIRSYAVFAFNVVGECDLYEQPFLCYEQKL